MLWIDPREESKRNSRLFAEFGENLSFFSLPGIAKIRLVCHFDANANGTPFAQCSKVGTRCSPTISFAFRTLATMREPLKAEVYLASMRINPIN